MNHIDAAASAAAAASASSAAGNLTYGGAVTAVVGGLTSNQIAAFGGLAIAFVGLVVQWYYRHREHKMRLLEHEARMSESRRQ